LNKYEYSTPICQRKKKRKEIHIQFIYSKILKVADESGYQKNNNHRMSAPKKETKNEYVKKKEGDTLI